jgi:hypothetical protein
MMRKLLAVAAVSTLLPVMSARGASNLPQVIQVVGQVTAAARPVEDVMIVAFGLKSFASHQSFSDRSGSFRLASLPSDVYRLIAVKHGFAPAVATIVPSAADLRVAIRLKEGKPPAETADQIWEIRRSLPPDILRELDAVMGIDGDGTPENQGFRLRGQMESLTTVNSEASVADYAQTAVELKGSANGWSVDIAGRLHETQNTPDFSARTVARSSGIAMALQTSPQQSVRIATMRNRWMLTQDGEAGEEPGLDSHRIEWNRDGSNVEVRYQSQQNHFRSPLLNSETFEVAGSKQLAESERSAWNVDFQVWQESPVTATELTSPYRAANLGTSGHYVVNDVVDLKYGLRTRFTEVGQRWMPESGAEIRVGKRTSVVLSGLYTFGDAYDSPTLPIVTSAQDFNSISPRYRYSFGLRSNDRKGNEVSAIVTVAEIDSMISMLFDDPASTVTSWDGYLLRAGDLHRDLTVSYRHNLANALFIDVAATAADTLSSVPGTSTKHFIVSNIRSFYRPSGTTMEVTYRLAQQPNNDLSLIDANGERLNLRMAQSLHLPLDLRVLVGLDLARDDFSEVTNEALQRRYVGGLSLAF